MNFRRFIMFMLLISCSTFVTSCSDSSKSTVVSNKPAASEQEKSRVRKQYNNYLKKLSTFPVSFKIGDKKYQGFGSDFKEQTRETKKEDKKETTTIVMSHNSGLKIILETVIYPDYAAYEWRISFTNTSDKDSPIISEWNAADVTFTGNNPKLIGILGDAIDETSVHQDAPKTEQKNNESYELLLPEGITTFAPRGGRPTDTAFPYYDFQYGDSGTLIAIGWQGQWKANFTVSGNQTVFQAGQETFASYLQPGETVISPFVAFVAYDGRNEERATNLWRRWMIDCNMPRVDDELYKPQLAGGIDWQCMSAPDAYEEKQLEYLTYFIDKEIPIRIWWMDAGWYTLDFEGTSAKQTQDYAYSGTWNMDITRFPTKLKSVSELANSVGIKTMLWFEPNRFGLDVFYGHEAPLATDGSTIRREWLIPAELGDETKFVNYGISEAVEWMANKIATVMEEGGISIYREDNNLPLLQAWLAHDGTNRAGITENLYVQGHMRLWDLLAERIPGLVIDVCGSGGRCNDLESLRRGMPFQISDFNNGARFITETQSVYYSLFKWFPYFGHLLDNQTLIFDEYWLYSTLIPSRLITVTPRLNKENLAVIKNYAKDFYELSEYFYADYYPLTEWSVDTDAWIGWQFIDPDKGKGFIQMTRREKSEMSEMTVQLRGLDEDATYELVDMKGNRIGTFSGVELSNGYTVVIPESRTAIIIRINRI